MAHDESPVMAQTVPQTQLTGFFFGRYGLLLEFRCGRESGSWAAVLQKTTRLRRRPLQKRPAISMCD
jgi:hypothetical protein